MNAFLPYNPNPCRKRVGDCVIRAISKATGDSWERTFVGICLKGFVLGDMPSANTVWGAYLREKGFSRYILPNNCPDCYTVRDFCEEHTDGTYVLALQGHVVAVQDGKYFDTWDSGEEVPLYFWAKEI